MKIEKYMNVLGDAFNKIKKFQTGEEKPIVTRYTHFNNCSLGGIFTGNIITIAARSGGGKSYILQQIEQDMFNKDLNPDCDKYVLLRCNWEMSAFKLMLRKLRAVLKIPIKKILFEIPDDKREAVMQEAFREEANPNVYTSYVPTSPSEFLKAVREFLHFHRDKKAVGITVDHHALVKDDGNKKKSMDELVEAMNELRSEFTNVFFILISQLNRDIEGRNNIKELAPRRSDLYNTDTLFQISDLVIVMHNPYMLGFQKYMHFHPSKYPHLIAHMENPELKNTNFRTEGVIFWHYLKIREVDDMLDDVPDLYIEHIL